jgi:hypothetical protein
MAIDCDASTGTIEAPPCVLGSGSGQPVTIAVVLTIAGASQDIGAFNFDVVGTNQPTLNPNAPVCPPPGLTCNPNFNEGIGGAGWSCGSAADLPQADRNPSPTTSSSFIGCINAVDAPTLAPGNYVLATVAYTTGADGVAPLALADVNVTDAFANNVGNCNPDVDFPMTCTDSSVQVGAVSDTPTPVGTATNTPTSTPSPTPCTPGVDFCPTTTPLAFVTVTPTPTATVAGAETPAAGESPPAGEPPPTGGQPDGTTGGAGRGPIRLPDTGSEGAGGGNGWLIALLAASFIGATGIAGGVWFGVRRQRGED